MFVGRQEEIKLIKEVAKEKGKSLLIYGKRKVGKTTLLLEALKDEEAKTIYYECLKTSLRENIDLFVERLFIEKIIPVKITFNSFQDVFEYLNNLPINFNIIIDEYPYLKLFENKEKVDSIFQNIIDNHLNNISLFISGSHIGMMKDLLEEKNALYGRFNCIINLKELNYIESSIFYNNKSIYEKIEIYSIFGGSPFVNKAINPNSSLKDNIINIILNQTSSIYNYLENLLISDLSNSISIE